MEIGAEPTMLGGSGRGDREDLKVDRRGRRGGDGAQRSAVQLVVGGERGCGRSKGLAKSPNPHLHTTVEVEGSWPRPGLYCSLYSTHISHLPPPLPGPAARGTAYAGGLQD